MRGTAYSGLSASCHAECISRSELPFRLGGCLAVGGRACVVSGLSLTQPWRFGDAGLRTCVISECCLSCVRHRVLSLQKAESLGFIEARSSHMLKRCWASNMLRFSGSCSSIVQGTEPGVHGGRGMSLILLTSTCVFLHGLPNTVPFSFMISVFSPLFILHSMNSIGLVYGQCHCIAAAVPLGSCEPRKPRALDAKDHISNPWALDLKAKILEPNKSFESNTEAARSGDVVRH